jgi:HlyD family secretion protein
MGNSKKGRKLVIFLVIAVVLVAVALSAAFKKREVVVSVTTEKVTRRDLTELIVANGKIQPVVQVVISPEVAGEIVALPVREGDAVKKGDLLVQIKDDSYRASRNSAESSFKSAVAGQTLAQAELDKAQAEFTRNEELFKNRLVSDSVMLDYKTAFHVAQLRYTNSVHSVAQAGFALERAVEDLNKTTIVSPMDGTIARLQSQLGERVLGTSFNKGTEIMIVADLSQMEARVDIGEIDIVLIKPGQKARLEVDSFRDQKFTGTVTEIANSSKGSSSSGFGGGGQSQEATKFEVRVRINEKASFRPGMSVSADIESRYRTNVLTVPMAAVTTRVPKSGVTNSAAGTNSSPAGKVTNEISNATATDRKSKDSAKPVEVVFVVQGDTAKMVRVKYGVSDGNYYEITEGLSEAQEIVSGNYKAVSKDLEDGKKIIKSSGDKSGEKDKK